MNTKCIAAGCKKDSRDGWAIYRVSPKGELFSGKCADHYDGPLDMIVQAIEDNNQRKQ